MDTDREPKVVVRDRKKVCKTAAIHGTKENMLHMLERTVDVAMNNLECHKAALEQAKYLIKRIKEEL